MKTQKKPQTQPSIILIYILLSSFLFLPFKGDSSNFIIISFIILWFIYLKDKFKAKIKKEVNMSWITTECITSSS